MELLGSRSRAGTKEFRRLCKILPTELFPWMHHEWRKFVFSHEFRGEEIHHLGHARFSLLGRFYQCRFSFKLFAKLSINLEFLKFQILLHLCCLIFLMDFCSLEFFLEWIVLPLFEFLHQLFSIIFIYLSLNLIEIFLFGCIMLIENILNSFLLLIFYLFFKTFYIAKYSLFLSF